MSMNKYMHPRNLYKKPPDFKELAFKYPEFKAHVKLDITGKTTFDFKDPEALKALSCILLKNDFDLDVEIPKNKLVPTIPLRLNYILWIEDLLHFLQREVHIRGIDIGTGASCVYPLIAAKKNQWSMLATETDKESIHCAQRNIEKNGLQQLINVMEVSEDKLLIGAIDEAQDYDFCMCNPPFFSSTQELHPFFKSRKLNRPHPKNAFVASVNEVVSKGGEVQFIQRIINESKELKSKIKLYTTMVGKKSNLPALKKSIREAGVCSFKETEFCQGNTTRWGLAWTYLDCDLRKMADQAKLACKPTKQHTPFHYELPYHETNLEDVTKNVEILLKMFKDLGMTFEEVTRNKMCQRYFVTAYSNTWTQQRKKRREKLRKMSENDHNYDLPENNNNETKNNSSLDTISPKKRNLDDLLCESTSKKLRLSTESESSEPSTVFFKFVCTVNYKNEKKIVELNTLDEFGNRDYLYQIMQYIKNNFNRISESTI